LALSDGRIIVEPTYEAFSGFAEGLAAVKREGKWGVIDIRGRRILAPRYDEVLWFSQGLARARQDGKDGYIDRNGRLVIDTKYYRAGVFSEGLATVGIGEGDDRRYGYINRKGRMVIPPRFRDAWSFNNGLAAARENELWGYIDKTGKFVIPPRFGRVNSFEEGVALVDDGKTDPIDDVPTGHIGLINVSGRLIAPMVYSRTLMHYVDGRMGVRREGKWGFLDTKGKEIIPCQYRDLEAFNDGLAPVKDWGSGKWGVIDRNGVMVVPPQFEHLAWFSCGRAPVNVGGTPTETRGGGIAGGKWGYINRTGQIVIPAVYDSALHFSVLGISEIWEGPKSTFIDRQGRPVNYWLMPNDDDSAIVPASMFDDLPEDTPRLSPTPEELMTMPD
jgi:hypothetical protein